MDKCFEEMLLAMWNRFHGKYRGTVVGNEDPKGIGRLRLEVPAVLGAEVQTGWALPCVPSAGPNAGLVLLPDVGDMVWVEFEGGNPSFPIWTGFFWGAPDDKTELPEEVTAPAVRMLSTRSGHKIVFDDEGEVLTVADAKGNTIVMDDAGVKVVDKHENEIILDGDRVKILSKKEVLLEADGGTVKLSSSEVTVSPDAAFAGKVKIGTGISKGVVEMELMTFLATHTHIGNTGAPTSPPVSPPTPALFSDALTHG